MARINKAEVPVVRERRNVRPGEHGYALGLAGFITSFFFSVVGLVLSIVGMVQSRKAGFKNPLALAGIIIGAVLTAFALIGLALATWGIVALVSYCNAHPNERSCTEYNQGYENGSRLQSPQDGTDKTY